MDLQPQPAAIAPQPSSQPAASQPVTAAPRIKRKHQSSEAEAAPEAAAPDAAEPLLPVRTSVRVKLRRSGSASKQPASNGALSGKQLSKAHGKRRHKHRHKHRHRSQAVPEEGAGVESLTGRGPGVDLLEGGLGSGRMQSSSGPGYSQELGALRGTWQNASGDQQAVDEEHSGESGHEAADAASGHSKSEEREDADQAAAAAFYTDAASGSHAEHATAMLSHGHRPSPAEDEQGAGQSHVTGAPHSQAQQGGFQMPRDTARSDLNQHEHLRALSMTESNAGADVVPHDQVAPTLQEEGVPSTEEGVPSTQACQIGISRNGQAALDQNESAAAAEQNSHNSDKQGWIHSSSAEVASPQQPFRQTGTEGSKSVDQMPPHSKGTADGHAADGDKAESQLRAARQLKQPE